MRRMVGVMTVIAWDGVTLAADKMLYFDSSHAVCTKIFKLDGVLAGFAGSAATGNECMAWIRGGRVPEEFPKKQAESNIGSLLVIETDGRIHQYYNSPYPTLIEDDYFAIGSGDEYALAAMYLGNTAEVAVKTAIALSPSCGLGMDTLTL